MSFRSFAFSSFIFCLIFYQGFVHAQSQKTDSLKFSLLHLKGISRIDQLNALSKEYRDLSILDSSRTFALKAAKESAELKYEFGSGEAYFNLASTGYEASQFIAAENYSQRSILYFKTIPAEKQLASSYVILAQNIWAQSRFEQAKESFEKATQIFLQLKDSTALGRTYSLMALEEEERGNYEKSFEYCMAAKSCDYDGASIALGQLYADIGDHTTALKYYNEIKSPDTKSNVDLKIGESYFLQGKYDSARSYFKSFINDSGSRSRQLLSKPYALLGGLCLKLGLYDSALFYLNTSLIDFKETNNRNWVMRVLFELGKTYKESGDNSPALEMARELLRLANETGARQYKRDAHLLLFELFDSTKKTDSAHYHLKQYTELNQAIDIDISARKLEFYKTASEREQSQLKLALLNQQKQLQQEEIKQSSQQKQFLLIGMLALIIIGIVVVRNVLLKKKNVEHLHELAANELRIQKLETKKQLGELEMDVLRTQMNPHFIFNSLNSINRFILKNDKLQASDYLTKFSRLVRMILHNSKSKMITLEQELASLELYLNLEALRFDDHFSYSITVQNSVDVSSLEVPPLIIQPYCENAVWHGLMNKEDKGHLDVDISIENELLCIKVTDDGIGREKAATLTSHLSNTHISMGLGITSRRIDQLHEPDSQKSFVVINDLVDGNGNPCGTEVIIKLPVTI